MAAKIEVRNGRLGYRLYCDGWESREPTGLRDTPKNRERLGRKAAAMSDEMAEGRFDYLRWFPNGTRAALHRAAPPPAPPQAQTVGQYITAKWLLHRSQPPLVRASLAATRAAQCRRYIVPLLGAIRLDELRPADLEDFRSTLVRPTREGGFGLAMKTGRDIIDSTMRAMYRDARKKDYPSAFGTTQPVAADPFAVLDWPRKIVPEPDPFDETERDRTVDHFWQRKRQYHAFVFVLFFTGLRIAEAIGLRWGDVDLRRSKLHVRRSRTYGEDNAPKTANATRTLTLLPEVVAVLRAVYPLRPTEDAFVFTTEHGTPLDRDRFVEKHWRPALRGCGVKLRKLYATRATFISVALTRKKGAKWLASYCGTSLEMIDKHYGRWMGGDEDELRGLGPSSSPAARTGTA